MLERACGTVPSKLFDTQIAAGFLGQVSPSLVNLVERILRIRLLKGDQLTDWTRRPLSAGQLAYAAGDVAHLLGASRGSSALASRRWEGRRGQTRSSPSCCTRTGLPDRPEEAWWRLPRSRQLRGSARGVAQCVAAWRERGRRRMDLPVRFVVPDLALLVDCPAPAPQPERICGEPVASTVAISAAARRTSCSSRGVDRPRAPGPAGSAFLLPTSSTSPTGP